MPEPLVPLDGDADVGVRDKWVLLQDAAGFGGAGGAEVVVFVVGEVGACGGGRGVRLNGVVVGGGGERTC